MALDSQGGISENYVTATTDEERELVTGLVRISGLPDYLKEQRGPTRLADLATHPDFAASAAVHQTPKTLLAAPIFARDELVGSLYLAEKQNEQEFTAEDEAVAAIFAAQAATLILNSQRHDETRDASLNFEAMLDNCPVAVSVFDVRFGTITYMNQEGRRMIGGLGLSDEELANFYSFVKTTRPDGRELAFAELPGTRAVLNGETVVAEELVTHRPDGTTLTSLIHCQPIFSGSGEIVSVLTIGQDLTSLQGQELRRAEFLEMVSAELRTPLISIKGSAAALRSIDEPMSRTEQLQLVRIIDQQSDLMRSQINSLIELSQIETGTLPVVAAPTDVARLIERSCAEYLSEHAAITIQSKISDGLTAALADEQRISDVLHNLLRQAAKHSGESSPVVVSAAMDDIHVAISVSAEGSSAPLGRTHLPSNVTDDPQFFSTADQAFTTAIELHSHGEGLAMAFCRGVVEAHGGRIRSDIDEELGRLTLTFTLPSVDDVPEPEIHAPDMTEIVWEPLPAPMEKIEVLVSVEDPRLLRSVRDVLVDAGYSAVTTSELDEVSELALSGRPKLIILDIAGREEQAFRTLRGAGNSLNLPAIVLCDRDDEDYVVRAFEMGADGYMVKPFSPSELIARVRATLRLMHSAEGITSDSTYQLADVRINLSDRTVSVAGQPVQLTATEYKLMAELTAGAGRVLTQDMLLHRVWGPGYSGESQLLRSYIKSLRQKLGDNARKPTYIFTEHGIGYRMAKSDPTDDRPVLASSNRQGTR